MSKKILTPQQQKEIKRAKNISKHIRIANATKGHENEIHTIKATNLGIKYDKLRTKENKE